MPAVRRRLADAELAATPASLSMDELAAPWAGEARGGYRPDCGPGPPGTGACPPRGAA
jgi:hypothetical protein